jgi:hypothetical protein
VPRGPGRRGAARRWRLTGARPGNWAFLRAGTANAQGTDRTERPDRGYKPPAVGVGFPDPVNSTTAASPSAKHAR